jgi:hypothetical protein
MKVVTKRTQQPTHKNRGASMPNTEQPFVNSPLLRKPKHCPVVSTVNPLSNQLSPGNDDADFLYR